MHGLLLTNFRGEKQEIFFMFSPSGEYHLNVAVHKEIQVTSRDRMIRYPNLDQKQLTIQGTMSILFLNLL